MRLFAALAAVLFMLVSTGCVSTICAGTSCDCPENTTCAFDACSASTDGCRLNCAAGAECTGTCGPDCNVTCSGKSCTHTVGAGSRVVCSAGTCNITCNGACTTTGVTALTCGGGTSGGPAGCS